MQKATSTSADKLLFSQMLAHEVSSFTPVFEQNLSQYMNSRSLQVQIGKQLTESGKTARLYLSHFIQVLNMSILRGEIKADARKQLGLEEYGSSLPDLSGDQQFIEIAQMVITGEERRTGNRIYNPSIANVKVKFEQFMEVYRKHKDILQTIVKHQARFIESREKADKLIVALWNEIEASLAPIDSDDKRAIAADYGVVYFYRPIERHKDFLKM